MGKQNWSDPSKAEPMLRNIPLGRFAEPHEVRPGPNLVPSAKVVTGVRCGALLAL